MNTIALLFKVLWAPRETMMQVATRPRVLVPLIFLTLFTAVEAGTLFIKLDPADLMQQQWQREGIADRISQADKDQLIAEKRGPIARVIVASAVRPLPSVTVVATLFFLAFALLGRQGDFKSFMSVTAFAFVPTIFRSLVAISMILALPASQTSLQQSGSLSLALLFNPASISRVAFVAAGLVDVISIWVLVLLVIGYGYLVPRRVGVVPRTLAVCGAFALYAVLRLTLAQFGNL